VTQEQTKQTDSQGQTVARTRIRGNHSGNHIDDVALPVSACPQLLSLDASRCGIQHKAVGYSAGATSIAPQNPGTSTWIRLGGHPSPY